MRTKLFIVFLIFGSVSSFAQLCQRNVLDCHGACGRFTDNDNDGICDFSPRSDAETQHPDTTAVAHPASKKRQSSECKKEKTDSVKQKVSADLQKPSVTSNKMTATDTLGIDTAKNQPVAVWNNNDKEKPYPLITIFILTTGLYFLTFLSVKLGWMKKSVHRKIWNILLLITFLVSGLLGLLLVVQLNYDFLMDRFKPLLTLHVDFGIAMAVISIFHIFWHLAYFKTIFGKMKK